MINIEGSNKRRKTDHLVSVSNTHVEELISVGDPRHFEKGHPYGVRPWGNSLTAGVQSCRANMGLFSCLDDALLLQIFGSFDCLILCKLAGVCRGFYVLAHNDDIWKSLVLERFEGNFRFVRSWKETFLREGFPTQAKLPHVPVAVPGFFSDLLYQPHLCATIPLPSYMFEVDNIERRSATDMSVEDFQRLYDAPNKPVLITDLVNQWPAFKKWSFETLENKFGDEPFHVGGYTFKLRDYFQYLHGVDKAGTHDMPLYLFDKHCIENNTLGCDYDVPDYFSYKEGKMHSDLFAVLGEARPDHRWLIVGPRRSGSSFHKDPNATSAWNAVIRGKKKWILFPPNVVPPGVHPSQDGADVATSVSVVEWLLDFYQHAKDEGMEFIECVCNEGELVFVPCNWWHIVLNLEPSIAITQNFVSAANLPKVLEFLALKDDRLVSGCDKSTRSQLYDNFVSKLKQECPEVLEQAMTKVNSKKEQILRRKRLAAVFQPKPTSKPSQIDKCASFASSPCMMHEINKESNKSPTQGFSFNFQF